jgi:hypothetical protein
MCMAFAGPLLYEDVLSSRSMAVMNATPRAMLAPYGLSSRHLNHVTVPVPVVILTYVAATHIVTLASVSCSPALEVGGRLSTEALQRQPVAHVGVVPALAMASSSRILRHLVNDVMSAGASDDTLVPPEVASQACFVLEAKLKLQ